MINLGLVFSGGIAKGAYQLGFCKSLNDNKDKFSIGCLSSSSIGILNSYALVCNKLDEAENIWKNVNISGIKLYKNVLKHDVIYRYIDSFCSDVCHIDIPFYMTLWTPPETKPRYERLDLITPDLVCDYLKAGISVAPFMNPVLINGTKYFDGAILDNTPLLPLKNEKCDVIIVIQFDNYVQEDVIEKINCPVIFVNLQDHMSQIGSFTADTVSVNQMIEYGYNACENLLTLIEKRIDNPNKFTCLVDCYNSRFTLKKSSGDRLVRRINRIMGMFN